MRNTILLLIFLPAFAAAQNVGQFGYVYAKDSLRLKTIVDSISRDTNISAASYRKLPSTKVVKSYADYHIASRPASITAPSSGQVIKWNGSAWAPATDVSGSGTDVGIINALDYGVVGDGVTDDVDSLQAAIDAAVGLRLWIPAGTYYISSELTVASNTEIVMSPGAKIDISSWAAAGTLGALRAFNISGTTSTTTSVTADIAVGAYDITVTSTTGFSAGDMVDITSTEPLHSGYSNRYKGWVTYVDSVLSSTVIRLANKSYFAIDAVGGSYTATLKKYNPVRRVKISGGRIVGGGFNKGHIGVYCSNFEDCIFEQISIDSCESNGFWLGTGIRPVVRNCHIKNATSPGYGIGTVGYGVGIGGGFGAIVENNYFENCRHSVAGGSNPPVFNPIIRSNYSYNCGLGTSDIDCHASVIGPIFENNTSHAGPDGIGGIIVRCTEAVVKGNHVYGGNILIRNADAITADANGPLGRVTLTDNIVKNYTSGAGIEFDEVGIKYASITGGIIEKCSLGVKVTNTLSAISISNVQFVDITATAITVDDCSGLSVTGCTFDSCKIGVETLSDSRNIIVSNCVGTCTANLIYTYLTDNVTVSNCVVNGVATSSALFFSRSNNVRAIGNNIHTRAGASYDAIRAWGSSATAHNITAIGNKATGSYKYGLYCFSNSDTITAIGNDFRQAITLPVYTPNATRVYFFGNINQAYDHGDIDESGSGPGLSIDTSAVTSLQIADNAVGSSEIAADAVGSSEIAANAVGSSEITADAVGNSELAANAVDSTNVINYGLSVLDLGQHGASSGQVLKWNGTQWAPATDNNTGTVTGTGAAGQVTYWSGASTITGENAFNYDATNNRLGVNKTSPAVTVDIQTANSTDGLRIQSDGTVDQDVWGVELAGVATGPYTQRGRISLDVFSNAGASPDGEAMVFTLTRDAGNTYKPLLLYRDQAIMNNSAGFTIANNSGRLRFQASSAGIFNTDNNWLLTSSSFTTNDANTRLKLVGSTQTSSSWSFRAFDGNAQSIFQIRDDSRVGITATTLDASLTINGAGATSGTYGLIVTPSGGTTTTGTLIVRDDNRVGVRTNAPQTPLNVVGTGTTSGSTAFLVEGSGGQDNFKTRDDGVNIGQGFAMESNAPSISFGLAAGTGPTADLVQGGANGFLIAFTTGTSPTTNAAIFTATLPKTYPNGVIATWSCGDTDCLDEAPDIYVSGTGNNSVTLSTRATLTASTTYLIYVTCFGY